MTTVSPEFNIEAEVNASIPEEQPIARNEPASVITVEQLLYVVIIAAAAILRLVNLGGQPLTPAEAQEALAVWQFWQPAGSEVIAGSPAYFSLTSFITQLGGTSDGLMRFIPALAGMGLVLLPIGLRPIIGRPAALLTSFFLAISPTLVSSSRTAGGDSLALFALFLLFVSWVHYKQTNDLRWLYLLSGMIGLGLTSAPLFYGGLATLAVTWALNRFIGEMDTNTAVEMLAEDETDTPKAAEAETETETETDTETETNVNHDRRNAAFIGTGVAVALGTFFLWNPSGIGSTAALFVSWLGQFTFNVTAQEWLNPVLAFGRYEAAVLLLGTIGAAWATWYGQNKTANLAAYWFIGGLFLLLIQAGHIPNILLLTLPGYLLIGLSVQHLFAQSDRLVEEWTRWPLAILLTILVAIMSKNLGRYARIQQFNADDASNLGLAVICGLMGFIIIALIVVWDYRSALQGILIPMLLAFTVLNWGQAWRLGHLAVNDTRERWVVEGTDDDVRLMVSTMEQMARQTKGSGRSATVFSAVDHPVMRWYLRGFPQADFGSSVPTAVNYDLVITPITTEPQFVADYVGSDFGYLRPNTENPLDTDGALRWWFFYQSPQRIADERVILWLRTNLLVRDIP